MCVVSIIGVLLAFPMKRRFINEEQLPFPEGRASGVVLDALYTGAASDRHVQGATAGRAPRCSRASYQAIISDGWMKLLQFKILRMDQWAGMKEPWTFHERLDTYYYAAVGKASQYVPTILGTDIRAARAAPHARRGDAGRRRPDGHRGRHQLPARRVHQLRRPGADHDPGRRHRRPRADRPARSFRSRAPRSSTSGRCGGA